MRKALIAFTFASLVAAQSYATYIVVLTNGTQYKAKQRWTVQNGKALVQLENGQTLQLDPSLIDVARSESQTKLGLGSVNVIAIDQAPAETKQQTSSLGSSLRLRKLPPAQSAAPAVAQTETAPAAMTGNGALSQEVIDKFARAYENVGLFEQKLYATGPHTLRAELTADSEDKVFNAISATSFLIVRNAGVSGAQVDMVELFMKTSTGGSSGRFQMTRTDADSLDKKRISQQEYFIRRVIY